MTTSTDTEQPYNFVFGEQVPPGGLQNSTIKLIPFDATKHAEEFFQQTKGNDAIYKHFAMGPFETIQDLNAKFFDIVAIRPSVMLFTIIDKRVPSLNDNPIDEEGSMAGVVGCLDTTPGHLCTEIGLIITFPAFRRKQLGKNSVALLLNWALTLPDKGGLGLRRVAWKAEETNTASIGLAECMGFKHEARFRWHFALEPNAVRKGNGVALREGDPKPHLVGGHSVMLSVCWDDWLGGVQELVSPLLK